MIKFWSVIPVAACAVSDGFNIWPSVFSVPKLAGTVYYSAIYAQSLTDMKGGYTGKSKRVLTSDIEDAQNILSEDLTNQAIDKLIAKVAQDYILLENATSKEVLEFSTDAKEGDSVDKFKASAKVKVKALVFRKEDVKKLLEDKINKNLPSYKNLLADSLDVTYDAGFVDMKKGTGSFQVSYKFSIYDDIDYSDLKPKMYKKSKSQIQDVISAEFGDSVYDQAVDFWPFWVKTAPKNDGRINITLGFK